MKIIVTVPADNYVLITKNDLGRLVAKLKEEGVFETFKTLDIQARAIDYKELPADHLDLTDNQEKILYELQELGIVPLYDGKKALGKHGYNRNTLRALVKKGVLEEREIKREPKKGPIRSKGPTTVQGYFVTALGKVRVESRSPLVLSGK